MTKNMSMSYLIPNQLHYNGFVKMVLYYPFLFLSICNELASVNYNYYW